MHAYVLYTEMAGANTAWQGLLLMLVLMSIMIGTVSSTHFRGAIIMARPALEGSQYDVSETGE